VPHVEQELIALPSEHLSAPLVFSVFGLLDLFCVVFSYNYMNLIFVNLDEVVTDYQ
jgi:hypothetical protein